MLILRPLREMLWMAEAYQGIICWGDSGVVTSIIKQSTMLFYKSFIDYSDIFFLSILVHVTCELIIQHTLI